jgi:3-oxoacyl-[acyl-carrier-protein] synthase-3
MCAAVDRLREQVGTPAIEGVDVLFSHSQFPDLPVVGCGGDVARRLGIAPSLVLDVHNGGCAAFILMLHLARTMFTAGTARSAMLLTATNAAGNVFTQDQVRTLPQAAIPGDGSAAALVTADPVDGGIEVRHVSIAQHSEYAGDMTAEIDPPRKYWEAGTGQLHVGFTESKIAKVLARGNRMVPEVALSAAAAGGLTGPQVGHLVTNQPNLPAELARGHGTAARASSRHLRRVRQSVRRRRPTHLRHRPRRRPDRTGGARRTRGVRSCG